MLHALYRLVAPFVLLVAHLLTACASSGPSDQAAPSRTIHSSLWSAASSGPLNQEPWTYYRLPGKAPSQFIYGVQDGRHAIAATAQSSASMLRQMLRVEPKDLGSLKFSWNLPALIEYADMAVREFDDSPVRVVLAFEGDRTKFSAKNAMLSELAQLLTGEPMPYATLMYVWCNECEPEKIIVNPHTDRIRKLPLESGADKLNRWLDYECDVRADFLKAFGEEPSLLTSISIMTDTDNTKSVARAWYGPVSLVPLAR